MRLDLDRTEWSRVRMGDVVSQSKEKVDPAAGSVERYVAGEHMKTDNLAIESWGEVNDGYLGPAFHCRFRPGQVLYGSRRTYLRKVAVARFDGVCANTTFVLEPKNPQTLLAALLPFIMTTEGFHAFSISESKGSVNPYVNWSDVAKYEFDLPPVDQQRRIADLLWTVEDEMEAANALTSSAINLQTAVVERHFVLGGGAIPRTLADYCPKDGIRIGPFGAQLHAYDYVKTGDVPVIMPQDMIDGSISTAKIQRISCVKASELTVHMVEEGDILLPRRGELDRRALVSKSEAGWLCGTGSVRVRVSPGVSVEAVFRAISSPSTVAWLKAKATGTTMPNLNAGIVAKIPVCVPVGDELGRALSLSRSAEKAVVKAQVRVATVGKLGSDLRNNLLKGT